MKRRAAKTFTDQQKAKILKYAKVHGPKKAGEKFKVHPVTVTNWRHGRFYKTGATTKQTYKKLLTMHRKFLEVIERLRPRVK